MVTSIIPKLELHCVTKISLPKNIICHQIPKLSQTKVSDRINLTNWTETEKIIGDINQNTNINHQIKQEKKTMLSYYEC